MIVLEHVVFNGKGGMSPEIRRLWWRRLMRLLGEVGLEMFRLKETYRIGK